MQIHFSATTNCEPQIGSPLFGSTYVRKPDILVTFEQLLTDEFALMNSCSNWERHLEGSLDSCNYTDIHIIYIHIKNINIYTNGR